MKIVSGRISFEKQTKVTTSAGNGGMLREENNWKGKHVREEPHRWTALAYIIYIHTIYIY